ncbi:hypothetical protein CEXT_549901, partial [Caerostris extrusa]
SVKFVSDVFDCK